MSQKEKSSTDTIDNRFFWGHFAHIGLTNKDILITAMRKETSSEPISSGSSVVIPGMRGKDNGDLLRGEFA